MKKTSIFLALFLLAGLGKSFAGYLKIINMTPCSFQFYSGYGTVTDPSTTPPTVYGFSFGPMTVGSMATVNYANPTLIPGYSGPAAPLGATGCAEVVKVNGPGTGFPIGKTPPINSYSSTNNPSCNGGNNYTMGWNPSSSGCDAVILIF